MKVQIHLKGLLPGTDDYIDEYCIIEYFTDFELYARIDQEIYECRIRKGYYKIKYQSIQEIKEITI